MNAETSPEFNQINEQLDKNQTATVLVETSRGDIITGAVFGTGHSGRAVAYESVHDKENNKIGLVPHNMSIERLSDAHQQILAEKLAGVALRGVEKPKPMTDTEVKIANLERAVRDAQAAKREAQQTGRGEDSIYWGQVAGQYSKELRSLRGK